MCLLSTNTKKCQTLLRVSKTSHIHNEYTYHIPSFCSTVTSSRNNGTKRVTNDTSVYLYLVDFREEATPYELSAEILPEVQFAHTGTETALTLSLAVRICTIGEEGRAAGLGAHVHIRYPCDVIYRS